MRRIYILSLVLIALCLIISSCAKRCRTIETYRGSMAVNMLINRPWMDEFPEKPEQPFVGYIFTDEAAGISDRADSLYKHLIEIFAFKSSAEKISFIFPHDRRKAESTYKVERIEFKGQFNLKLTLQKDPQMKGKTYVYFSNTNWNIKNEETIPEEIRGFCSLIRGFK